MPGTKKDGQEAENSLAPLWKQVAPQQNGKFEVFLKQNSTGE